MGERRLGLRARKRLGCEIRAKTRRYFGMVLNVSAEGLYVQTNARIDPGLVVELGLSTPIDRVSFTLRGRIARAYQTPVQLASVAPGGVGVRLIDPPASYLEYVRGLLAGSRQRGESAPEAAPLEGGFAFRVEMQTEVGGETRTLLVSCQTEAEAAELAQAELDEGWKLVSVARL
jgi:hypothetical protein